MTLSLKKLQDSISLYSTKDPVFPTAMIENLIMQRIDFETESVEQSNFDTLISNSIRTLIWAHRMHSLLQHYKSELDANPTEKYKMCLEFEEDMKNLFDQQYKYLKHYAENIKNENLFFQSHRGLEVINSLYK